MEENIQTKMKSGNDRVITQPFVVVGSVIKKYNKYLLVEQNGKWNLPQGWLEMEEKLAEGAVREAREETGYQIKISSILGIFPMVKHKEGKTIHAVRVIFLAEAIRKTIVSQELKTEWFSLKEMKEKQMEFWDSDVVEILNLAEKRVKFPKNIIVEKIVS